MYGAVVRMLAVERLEAILPKQLLIIRRIVGSAVYRRAEVFGKKTPPLVPVAEVDGSVHSGEAPLAKPGAAGIEQHIRGLLVIHTLKEAHSPGAQEGILLLAGTTYGRES